MWILFIYYILKYIFSRSNRFNLITETFFLIRIAIDFFIYSNLFKLDNNNYIINYIINLKNIIEFFHNIIDYYIFIEFMVKNIHNIHR